MQWDWWWEAWPRISFLLNRSIIALRCYVRICYTTVWVSCMCTCVSSLLDLPTIIPPVSHHRAPSWGPCTIRQCPTSSLLYTGECTYVSAEGLFSPYFFYHGADLDRVMWNNQFSSVTQSCLTLCDPMDCSMPGLPVHHQLLELAQTHVHWVSDAIQPSHPLSSPFPLAFNLSQHRGLFQWDYF